MEIRQLRYFAAVARTGSFSRAARECHVAQPSLSQQIIKLEEEVGEQLFERTQRKALLTNVTIHGNQARLTSSRVMSWKSSAPSPVARTPIEKCGSSSTRPKHPEGSFKLVNALAMAASYDPDPTESLGIRLPVADRPR